MPWKGKPFGWGRPEPYLSYLPEPEDASANLIRQLSEHLSNGEEIGSELKLGLNCLESPSNYLAMELMFQAYNSELKLKLSVGSVPKPDPRKSKSKFKLWKYWFKKASVAVPEPAKQFRDICSVLALQEYSYEGSWMEAATFARKIHVDQRHEVLAVMVHPPAVRDAIPAHIWLTRIQLASAQIVAHIEINNQIAIEDSALVEVIRGPLDWAIDAAIIALTQRARKFPDCSSDVQAYLSELLDRIPQEGYWSNLETTFRNVLLLPNVAEEDRIEIERTLAAIAQA